MAMRIGFAACGVLLLVLTLIAVWATWDDASRHDAWILDEPVRTISDFASREKVDASFRMRNTARVPLRILGASTC